jgi:hypothetical protein
MGASLKPPLNFVRNVRFAWLPPKERLKKFFLMKSLKKHKNPLPQGFQIPF